MKKKFFLYHLFFSACVITVVILVFKIAYYPDFFSEATGATRIFSILIGVDLILGPGLTLILFKEDKPGLKFDLGVIFLIQIAAVIFGSHSLYKARPAYIVFVVDRFEIVQYNQLLDKFPSNLKPSHHLYGIPIVSSKLPEDIDDRNEFMLQRMAGGAELFQTQNHYHNFSFIENEGKLASIPASFFFKHADQTLSAKFDLNSAALDVLPITSSKKDYTALVNFEKGKIVRVLKYDAWSIIDKYREKQ